MKNIRQILEFDVNLRIKLYLVRLELTWYTIGDNSKKGNARDTTTFQALKEVINQELWWSTIAYCLKIIHYQMWYH